MTREEVQTHTDAISTVLADAISRDAEPSKADQAILLNSGVALLGGFLINVARMADCAEEALTYTRTVR